MTTKTHEHEWNHREAVRGGCYYWCSCGSRLEVRYPDSETELSALENKAAKRVVVTPRGEFIHLS